MLKRKIFGDCPLRGVEVVYPGIHYIVLPRGINNIKCKKKNKKNPIIKKGPDKGPSIDYMLCGLVTTRVKFLISNMFMVTFFTTSPSRG